MHTNRTAAVAVTAAGSVFSYIYIDECWCWCWCGAAVVYDGVRNLNYKLKQINSLFSMNTQNTHLNVHTTFIYVCMYICVYLCIACICC